MATLAPCKPLDLENPDLVESILRPKGESFVCSFRSRIAGDQAFTECLVLANDRGGFDVRLARGGNPAFVLEHADESWPTLVGNLLSQSRAKPGYAEQFLGRDVPTPAGTSLGEIKAAFLYHTEMARSLTDPAGRARAAAATLRDAQTSQRLQMAIEKESSASSVEALVAALRGMTISVAAPSVTVAPSPAPNVTVNVTPDVTLSPSSETRTVTIERDFNGRINGATIG